MNTHAASEPDPTPHCRPEPSEAETLAIVERLHAGQVDWANNPYVGHLLAVRDLLGPASSEVERKSALLHDTLEDVLIQDGSPEGRRMQAEDLRALGFREEIIEVVQLLTKPDEPKGWWRGRPRAEVLVENDRRYFEQIGRIVASGNLAAMRIKLADNTHNGDPARDAGLTDPKLLERSRRFRDRYARSAAMLREAIVALEATPASAGPSSR